MQHFLLFPYCFPPFPKQISIFQRHCTSNHEYFVVCKCFELDQSKSFLFVKESPFTELCLRNFLYDLFFFSDITKLPEGNNNNNDVIDNFKGSHTKNGGWKLWQRVSQRKSKHSKTNAEKYVISSPLELATESPDNLPDVVDIKTEIKRSSSLKPPPKPPRLFIFRSSSINTPRSSYVGESDRDSFILSQAYQNGGKGDITFTDKVKRDSKEIPAKPDDEPAEKVSVEIDKNEPQVVSAVPPLTKLKSQSLPYNQSVPSQPPVIKRDQLRSSTGKIKIVSPELSRKPTAKIRKKSGEVTSEDRHVLIMQCSTELLCQKIDPFLIIEDLAQSNILTKDDLSNLRGQPDRWLICDNIVQAVIDRDYQTFLRFCDLLRSKTDYISVASVLDGMRAVYDLIYEVPEEQTNSPVPEDERSVSFDVVYFSTETGKIRSVIELEKNRSTENKRYSRDLLTLSSKRNSRLSFHSLTSEASSMCTEDIINTGIPMVTVSIAGHSLGYKRAEGLAEVLKKHSCILELHIGKTHLKGSDAEHIMNGLAENTCLRILDLRLNNIGNEAAAYIGSCLRQNKSLKQLNLSSTGIDAEGCKVIADSLCMNTYLIDLDLSFLEVGDGGCLAISDMLRQNRCLKKLRLRSAGISWIGCGFLIEGVEQGKTVTELDLSRNFIGDKGIEMLMQHLKDDSVLRDVNLENCGLTVTGCNTLSDVILTNKSIRHIDLSVNFIGDQGIGRLSNALQRNKQLQTLGLNMCGISNDGFSKLLDILEANPTLKLLKLCYNRLGREHENPEATSDNLKYRIRIVTSSNPKLKLLLWGNAFEEAHSHSIANFVPRV